MDLELIRLPIFLGLFVLFAAMEAWLPRRVRRFSKTRRWITNWLFSLSNSLTVWALPLVAVGAALDAGANGWGLFNQLGWPGAVEVLLTILIFDFAIWAQHLITHKIPLLWRLHRVHHADVEIDVSTAIRFHPLEIALSMLVKVGLVYVIGPSALAIILFEVILNGTAMFNHSNLRLPLGFDALLRRVLVTPDMHRVHHSVHRHEHDSNYGFALSIWDRIFGTYIAQPKEGHETMKIGLEWQDTRPTQFPWSFALPFFRK